MAYDDEDLDRMKLIKPGASAFILMMVLSVCVHAAAIGWVSRFPGIGLAGLLASEDISVRIVTEERAGRGGAAPKGTFADSPQKGAAMDSREGATGDSGGGDEHPIPVVQADRQADSSAVSSTDAVSNAAENDAAPPAGDQVAETEASLKAPEYLSPKPAPSATPGLLKVSRERFFFEIYWLGVYVGKAVLEAENAGGIQRITSRVHSAPVISAFYKVEDFAESTVSGDSPVRFRIKQREGKYRSDKETLFDVGGRVTYFDHLKGIREEHEVRDKVLFDVISGFFHLRTRPMEAGSTVLLDVFDSNKFLVTEVHVLRNEQVVFLGRETEATVVRPVLKSEGLFQSKGDIFIWLTNDERRIPVRVETKVGIGTVVAELKGMEREP